ncbi:YiiG family protein [Yokenella regensburgei]
MVAAVLCLPLAACDNNDAPKEKPAAAPDAKPAAAPGAKPAATASATPAVEDPTEQLTAKVNHYIECFNTADGSVHDSAERYVSWIDNVETGPTGKERKVYTLGHIPAYQVESCTKAINQAVKAKPALPALDDAATKYLTELTTLAPLVSQAHQYYSQEDYKDDGFAKGKEMHQPLMKAFKAFMNASDVYGAELEKESSALNAAQLAEIEKTEGKHLAYYRLALVSQGKDLTMLFDAESPDVNNVIKAIEAYGALLEEARQSTANDQDKPIGWSVFLSRAETFLKDSKDMMRRLRDKTPYSQGDKMMMEGGSGWMVSGSPMRVLKSYNEMVQASNSL